MSRRPLTSAEREELHALVRELNTDIELAKYLGHTGSVGILTESRRNALDDLNRDSVQEPL